MEILVTHLLTNLIFLKAGCNFVFYIPRSLVRNLDQILSPYTTISFYVSSCHLLALKMIACNKRSFMVDQGSVKLKYFTLQGKSCWRYRLWSPLWKTCHHVWCPFPVHTEQVSSMMTCCYAFFFEEEILGTSSYSALYAFSLWEIYVTVWIKIMKLHCLWCDRWKHCFCRILLARLEYLRDTFQIKEGDFLTFDALVCFHWALSQKSIYIMAVWFHDFSFSWEILVVLLIEFYWNRDKLLNAWAGWSAQRRIMGWWSLLTKGVYPHTSCLAHILFSNSCTYQWSFVLFYSK